MTNLQDIFGEVISRYSRVEALEDGVLVDISELAREAGFRYPIAVTQAIFAVLDPSPELKAQGQSFTGRAWDLLAVLKYEIRRQPAGDRVTLAPLFILEPGDTPQPVQMWSVCGPGDNAEPVITVLIDGED